MYASRRLTAALSLALLAGCSAAPRSEVAPRPAAAEGRLVLMGTTDLHGWILPWDYYTGQRTNNALASLVENEGKPDVVPAQ